MERSLSALLPVENVQSSLADTVSRILEILPELTEDFELVIIDDGSIDATIEVADELVVQYPQVRVVHHGDRQGRAAALKSGVERSAGDILFIADDDCRLPIAEVAKLWKAIDTHQVVLGRAVAPDEPESPTDETPDETVQGGFQMLSREATEPVSASLANQTALRTRLAELGQPWHNIDVPLAAPSTKTDSPQTRPRRPVYLGTSKDTRVRK